MAQGMMAGMTSYENQSLSDICEDIKSWIEYSDDVKKSVEDKLKRIKSSQFYNKIPYNYKAMIHEIPQICQTNINDLNRTKQAIESHSLTEKIVSLFRKIGTRAIGNSDDNKKYYKSCDDGYWHDYDNPDFRIVEEIYAMFGDYCATLWDVTNAASRLKDYTDIPSEITTIKYINNSVNVGDNNNFSDSIVGSNNKADVEQKTEPKEKESWISKSFWQILVPIAVGVIVVAIAVWLGLQ